MKSLNFSRLGNSTSVGLPTSEPGSSPSMRSSCGLTRSSRWLRTRQTPTIALSRIASPSCFARSVSVTSRVVITATSSPSQSNAAAVISTECSVPSLDQATERKSRTQPCDAIARPSASIGSSSRQKPSSTPLRPITFDSSSPTNCMNAGLASSTRPSRMLATQTASGLSRNRRSSMACERCSSRCASTSAVALRLAPHQPRWRPVASNTGSPLPLMNSSLPLAVTNWITRSR